MKPQESKAYTLVTLAVGVLAGVGALVRAGDNASSLISGFTLWTLSPYAALFACDRLARTTGRALTVFIFSLLVTLFALVCYGGSLFGHVSSTVGLIFVFIPLYQLIAALILLVVLLFTRPSDGRMR
jgi:hypothetical protein